MPAGNTVRALAGGGELRLVDAHVHVHACFETAAFLDAAAGNLARGAAALGLPADGGCLALTESAGARWFQRCAAGEIATGGWALAPTSEPGSLLALREATTLALVAGRQVVTRERIEVLALCCPEAPPDGLPACEAIERVRAAGGIPVLPWGFGKWWFARRALVARLARGCGPLFLGDNGGRPRVGPDPALFARARAVGVPVLPGSDPLPFPREQDRGGRSGFVLPRPLDLRAPAASLREQLLALARDGRQPQPFGAGERLVRFAALQVAMQLRRHAPGTAR